MKQLLVESPLLAHYDTDLPIVLAADASANGVGVVVSTHAHGSEWPITYLCIKDVVEKYAQVDKEALLLVFGVHKYPK